jgi:hypothetical protein
LPIPGLRLNHRTIIFWQPPYRWISDHVRQLLLLLLFVIGSAYKRKPFKCQTRYNVQRTMPIVSPPYGKSTVQKPALGFRFDVYMIGMCRWWCVTWSEGCKLHCVHWRYYAKTKSGTHDRNAQRFPINLHNIILYDR